MSTTPTTTSTTPSETDPIGTRYEDADGDTWTRSREGWDLRYASTGSIGRPHRGLSGFTTSQTAEYGPFVRLTEAGR